LCFILPLPVRYTKTMRAHPHAESLRKLKKVKLHENGEQLVNLEEYPLQLHPQVIPFLRQQVAERLVQAQNRLPQGYRLLVLDGLQAPSSIHEQWDAHYKKLEYEHPFWPARLLHQMTNHYFHPHNHTVPHAHTTGGAVDIVLTNAEGTLFDLVPPLSDWNLGHTRSKKVPIGAQHRRRLLLEVMTGAGFSNFPHEYWHYSYGDAGWASRSGHKTCFYGAINEIEGLKKAASSEATEKRLAVT